jgi:hypothetical protein
MKIEYSTNDGSTWSTLADGGISSFRVAASKSFEPLPRIRATHSSVAGRGNLLHTITFDVRTEQSTPGAAEAYCLDHADQLPQTARVRWTLSDGTTMREMEAEMQTTALSHIGVSVLASYRLHGGAITTPEPEEPEE